jgi:predicted metal-dependent hydrolase
MARAESLSMSAATTIDLPEHTKSSAPEPRALRVRVPRLAFDTAPRHWFGGSPAATHLANAVNLLFPAGERFFVRSVRHYEAELPPELRARVKGFYGQEGRHAQAHERLFDTLRAQGFEIDGLLSRYEAIAYRRFERRSPPALRLAITAALEHFTAILAEDALTGGELVDADPAMRGLFEWHAVEELEHKSVAFDVLRLVAPSYLLRVLGMVMGALFLGGFWLWMMRELLRQDGSTLRAASKELGRAQEEARARGHRAESITRGVFLRGIREYLRPGFHPDDRDHRDLIATTLARLARAGIVEA